MPALVLPDRKILHKSYTPIVTDPPFSTFIQEVTGASRFEVEEVMQELWSGYGQILRLRLHGCEHQTVVAKFIDLPYKAHHPRGWSTNLSHQRKVRSYEVESHFYQNQNGACDAHCRTPQLLGSLQDGEQTLLLLEDLDASGFPNRLTSLTFEQVNLCLKWLAEFHATFLQENPSPPAGLWETGTYWHLATRPDELVALDDEALKAAAPAIDAALSEARYQTLVHGDAKLANFCFSQNGDQVAALDFQYVGGGCGMKDVAYFLGSCLDEEAIEQQESELLDSYFSFLTKALSRRRSTLDPAALITEWRSLYPYAWTDFHRFLKGWCPTHWKLNSYSERMSCEVLDDL
ncbi:MAG: phosphotransferase [Roseibacillus sp.]